MLYLEHSIAILTVFYRKMGYCHRVVPNITRIAGWICTHGPRIKHPLCNKLWISTGQYRLTIDLYLAQNQADNRTIAQAACGAILTEMSQSIRQALLLKPKFRISKLKLNVYIY